MVGGVGVGGEDAEGVLSVGLAYVCCEGVHGAGCAGHGEGAVDEVVLGIYNQEHFPEAVHYGVDFGADPAVCFGVDGGVNEFFGEVYAAAGRGCAQEQGVETMGAEARAVEGVGVFEDGIECFYPRGFVAEFLSDGFDSEAVVEVVEANQEDSLGVEYDFGVLAAVFFVVDGGACSVAFVVAFVEAAGVVEDGCLREDFEGIGVVAEYVVAYCECVEEHAAAVAGGVYEAVGTVEAYFAIKESAPVSVEAPDFGCEGGEVGCSIHIYHKYTTFQSR